MAAKKIQYSVSMRPNPQHEDDPQKAYAFIQLTGKYTLDDLAEHMNGHYGTYSKGTFKGIIEDMAGKKGEEGGFVRRGFVQGFVQRIRTLGIRAQHSCAAFVRGIRARLSAARRCPPTERGWRGRAGGLRGPSRRG